MKKIGLSKLQNTEHLALMEDVLKLLKETNIEPLKELTSAFESQVTRAEEAQKQIRKSEHTQELATLDEKRDDIYRGLAHRVQAELFAPVQERKKAAQKVQIVLDTYGNFTKENYRKETRTIQDFVTELRSESYLDSVQKIGLQEWVGWLEEANNTFDTLFSSRRDEYAAQPVYDVKALRKELDETFRKLQETTKALSILQPSDTLKTFIAKADATITKWQEVIWQREGKKSAEKSASTDKSAS